MFLLTVFEFSEKTVLKDSGSIDVSVCYISSHKIIPNILIDITKAEPSVRIRVSLTLS